MQATAQKLATYADIEALPPHVTGQIIDGELFASPRPAPAHAVTSSRLLTVINASFDLGLLGPGGWRIVHEPELHLADTVLVPDMAGWRLPNWSDGIETAGIEVTPDWICEVLSPSTQGFDRGRKLLTYARLGVRHAWLVHPIEHIVEVYTLKDGAWMLVTVETGNAELCAVPFDAISIPLRKMWLNPPDDDPVAGEADPAE